MQDRTRTRLLVLAGIFLCLFALGLSLSPAGRLRSWSVDYRMGHWLGMGVWIALAWSAAREVRRRLPESDPYLLPVALLLTGWGLLTIWRLDGGFGTRQAVWLGVSGVLLLLGLGLPADLSFLRRYKYLLLTIGLAVTALTLVFGTNPAGSGPRLWLGCCGIYLQPSEPLKLLLIAYLAAYFADHPLDGRRIFPFILPTLVVTGLALLILIVQRDLGTASIFIVLYTVMLFLTTGRRRVLLASAGMLAAAGLAGYFLVGIIRVRVDAWLDPWADPSGGGFQVIQSLLAVANGGMLGRGPGMGSPGLVPVSISDFVFSALAEEAGLIGTLPLLALFFLLTARGLQTALRAPDRFRRLLAGGLSAYFGVQALLIVGGNLRLLPLTGVTLPFVSYGGSSLVTSFVALLLLLLISGEQDEEPAPLARPAPYLWTGTLLGAGFLAAALVNGWWGFIRGPDLLTRTDNQRRNIADRYVARGNLLDRQNEPITVTLGQSGEFTRAYLVPELGPLIGYTHPVYGQAGLEAGLDPYLRGLQGNPASLIWWDHLLYGQPPPGLDVRLSIDLPLQRAADDLLGQHAGAVVLIDAQNGEILVLASHPAFDPNRLDEQITAYQQDPLSPLVNRATQGQYPPGTAVTPLVLAAALAQGNLPDLPGTFGLIINGQPYDCVRPPGVEPDWGAAVANGCPGALATLGEALGEPGLAQALAAAGLYSAPDLPLLVAAPTTLPTAVDPYALVTGQSALRVSPLQMALAAAALSRDGIRPAARVALAVDTPQQGWVILPTRDDPSTAWPAWAADEAAGLLSADDAALWESFGQDGGASLTWYLAGSPPDWQGTPLTVVVLLEEDNPSLARYIGRRLMELARQAD